MQQPGVTKYSDNEAAVLCMQQLPEVLLTHQCGFKHKEDERPAINHLA